MLYRHLGRSGLQVSVLGLGNYVNAASMSDEEAYGLYVEAFRRGVVRSSPTHQQLSLALPLAHFAMGDSEWRETKER